MRQSRQLVGTYTPWSLARHIHSCRQVAEPEETRRPHERFTLSKLTRPPQVVSDEISARATSSGGQQSIETCSDRGVMTPGGPPSSSRTPNEARLTVSSRKGSPFVGASFISVVVRERPVDPVALGLGPRRRPCLLNSWRFRARITVTRQWSQSRHALFVDHASPAAIQFIWHSPRVRLLNEQ